MTELRIPWPDGAAWQQTITLDRKVYRFTARWNEIAEAWFMDIATRAGDMILSGIKITGGVLISARYADPRLPPGYFVVIENAECGCTPRRNDMRENARLIYVSAL
jgi:hypothetical protein